MIDMIVVVEAASAVRRMTVMVFAKVGLISLNYALLHNFFFRCETVVNISVAEVSWICYDHQAVEMEDWVWNGLVRIQDGLVLRVCKGKRSILSILLV